MTMLRSFTTHGVQVGFALALLGLWQWGSLHVHSFLLPSPASVGRALVGLVATGEILPALFTTVIEHLTSFGLAAALGLLTGYLVSRTWLSKEVMEPLFAAAYSVPAVLLLPSFLLVFGVGVGSKIALGFLIAFFPIVLSTISAFGDVQPNLIRAAKSMGANQRQLFWRVLLPAGLPMVLSGLRIGAITSLLGILGAEAIASLDGLGHAIVERVEYLETDEMYAIIVIAIGIAFLVNVASMVVDAWGRRNFS